MRIPRDGADFAALIAERMKEQRGKRLGWEMASEAGITTSTWCRMEQGKPCNLHDLTLILHWLGLTELVRDTEGE